jgi:NADPH:quinone reductase-like Zn-dependent oxidoreductase
MPLPQTFKAMVVSKRPTRNSSEDKKKLSDLPAGELLVEVKYSSLNYKDALSASGNKA